MHRITLQKITISSVRLQIPPKPVNCMHIDSIEVGKKFLDVLGSQTTRHSSV